VTFHDLVRHVKLLVFVNGQCCLHSTLLWICWPPLAWLLSVISPKFVTPAIHISITFHDPGLIPGLSRPGKCDFYIPGYVQTFVKYSYCKYKQYKWPTMLSRHSTTWALSKDQQHPFYLLLTAVHCSPSAAGCCDRQSSMSGLLFVAAGNKSSKLSLFNTHTQPKRSVH